MPHRMLCAPQGRSFISLWEGRASPNVGMSPRPISLWTELISHRDRTDVSIVKLLSLLIPSFFIAGHFLGNFTVIEVLRQAGYKVTKVGPRERIRR